MADDPLGPDNMTPGSKNHRFQLPGVFVKELYKSSEK